MIQVGILGCGTVAGGTIRILTDNKAEIEKRIGEAVVIKKVLARTPEKAKRLGLRDDQIASSIDEIALDPDITLVAELMGGTDTAYAYILRCMEHGKHIVTANKDLLALRWDELMGNAQARGLDLFFEASVAGAIPIIGSVRQTLSANNFKSVTGILNGTTNYILSKMTGEGSSYETALKDAQQLGYAEANPASDVEGLDAARKIVILANLAFHARFLLSDVLLQGITAVTAQDIRDADAAGFVIKLLASAKREDGAVSLSVRPTFVPKAHPLATVGDAVNAVFLVTDAADETFLMGRGAGAMPTGSSVVGDIMEICRLEHAGAHARFALDCYAEKALAGKEAFTAKFALLTDGVTDGDAVLCALESAGIAIEKRTAAVRQDGTNALLLLSAPVQEAALTSALRTLVQSGAAARVKHYACIAG